MAKPRYDVRKDKMWRKAIADWHASGLSATIFCSRNNIKLSSFCDWRRAIQKRDAVKATERKRSTTTAAAEPARVGDPDNTFVPVVLTGAPIREARGHAVEITLKNGVIISVQENCSAALLSSVFKILEGSHV